ncbi:MAG: hypothetical protein AB1715_02565 [Acidobacteriota bacterium]
MLYNFPLLTYAAKGRMHLQKALELRPVDEDLNVNVVYAYLAQWDRLSGVEREFVYAVVARNLETDANFFPRVMALWRREFKDSARLKDIFTENKDLWAKLFRYFPVLKSRLFPFFPRLFDQTHFQRSSSSFKAKTRASRRCFIQESPSLLKADKSESVRSRLYG